MTVEQAILFVERAAESAGIQLEMDLESFYDEDELGDYATREDICELLYYALTQNTVGFNGEPSNSDSLNQQPPGAYGTAGYANTTVTTIAYTVDEDETVTLDGSDFADACEDATDEDFSYIKFTSVTATGGKLYVDYDETTARTQKR